MADDVLQRDLITYDPLSETTRKERTSLLGVSMLGIALVKVPLVPEKFSALGVDFEKINQVAFVQMFTLVVAYYAIAFMIYGWTDFVAWSRKETMQMREYENAIGERLAKQTEIAGEGERPKLPLYQKNASWVSAVMSSRIRGMFEFILPVVVALYSMNTLRLYVLAH